MKDALIYKGLSGTVHYSLEERIFFGKIEGIKEPVVFEGDTLEEVEKAFQEMVDCHLMDGGE